MTISDELRDIFRRCQTCRSVAEMDVCIAEYKTQLGDTEDESGGLHHMQQLRNARAQQKIVESRAHLAGRPGTDKLS
ncbi:hypothetical protein SG34_007065 [Thalassomonas viridans]|uniref:Uncharacterized protein n=1 Tax=Thalassomonas viridans TaxID=137584 RepID=A0AAF0CAT0_9GAMM|nr:hypothetical protein [Thalassomonas viridans]WDE06660.1 hypothetical protein SG34_007065 [Thalassomonas viridans]